MRYLAGIGLLYEPEEKVTIAEMLSNHLEVDDVIIDKVRTAVLLK